MVKGCTDNLKPVHTSPRTTLFLDEYTLNAYCIYNNDIQVVARVRITTRLLAATLCLFVCDNPNPCEFYWVSYNIT